MAETVATRVARGAALLDKADQGWAKRVNISTLDMNSGNHCITAQLSGMRYIDARVQLMHWAGVRTNIDDFAAEHGFQDAPYSIAGGKTKAAWLREIKKRTETKE